MVSRVRLGAFFSALLLTFTLVGVDYADARRGGSFGSRGFRTHQSAPATRTAPSQTAPLQRSMTPQSAQPGNAAAAAGQTQGRRGLFGGLGGGLLGGLMLGGLFGMLMGTGFGGFGGILAFMVQILLIGVGAMLLMRFLAKRNAPAGNTGRGMHRSFEADGPSRAQAGGGFPIPPLGQRAHANAQAQPAREASTATDEIGITDKDLDMFEQRLQELQAAFSREDYAALRRICTPEIVSYLSEELSENATSGRKNDVTDVQLLQGDLAESWNEPSGDYATVAMRYSSIDLMRDRESGAVLSGTEGQASETTELWTFTRPSSLEAWKVSAIQES